MQSHGGPTSGTSTALSLPLQYWTSRGFAVLDVNYGGSTGYGRPYRQRLNDAWACRVDDHVNGAKYLIERGLVGIPSAPPFVAGAPVATRRSPPSRSAIFRAGASHFGISDLETMATDTHKFESR